LYAVNKNLERVVKMHTKTAFKKLLRVEKIVIENVYFEDVNNEEIFVVKVRPEKREINRCPHCGKCCPGYNDSKKIRRWRSLDFGSTKVYIEANSPRIKCSEHGVIVARVPWARHNSDYTYDFETAVTWFTLHATIQDVAEYFRIVWRSVGGIVNRVQKSLEESQPNRFDDLQEIGIDDPFHVVGWATAALDEVRKATVREAKKDVEKEKNKTEKKREM